MLPEEIDLKNTDFLDNSQSSKKITISARHINPALWAYLNKIGKIDTLTRDEIIELIKRFKDGDVQIKQKIVEANLRLVVFLARRFPTSDTVSFLDKIQEGNIGLLKAVEKFEPERGFSFASYAIWDIRRSIDHAISDKAGDVQLPSYINAEARLIELFRRHLSQKLFYEPTDQELIDAYSAFMETEKEPVEKIIESSRIRCISMQEPLAEGATSFEDDESKYDKSQHTLEDSIPGKALTEEQIIDKIDSAKIPQALSCLKPKWRKIIEMRFGFDDGEGKTLKEVGQVFGVTRERIRQIEANALKRLNKWGRRELGEIKPVVKQPFKAKQALNKKSVIAKKTTKYIAPSQDDLNTAYSFVPDNTHAEFAHSIQPDSFFVNASLKVTKEQRRWICALFLFGFGDKSGGQELVHHLANNIFRCSESKIRQALSFTDLDSAKESRKIQKKHYASLYTDPENIKIDLKAYAGLLGPGKTPSDLKTYIVSNEVICSNGMPVKWATYLNHAGIALGLAKGSLEAQAERSAILKELLKIAGYTKS